MVFGLGMGLGYWVYLFWCLFASSLVCRWVFIESDALEGLGKVQHLCYLEVHIQLLVWGLSSFTPASLVRVQQVCFILVSVSYFSMGRECFTCAGIKQA